MNKTTKCLPLGALPYDKLKLATAMVAKLYNQLPFIALLPNISQLDTIEYRSFQNLPGISYENGKVSLNQISYTFNDEISDLDRAFKSSKIDNLDKYGFDAEFMEKYFHMIKKFNPQYAMVNLLGPFTISQILTASANELMLTDKSYKRLFTHAVCVKALWMIDKIKHCCPQTVPVIILEEPMFTKYGELKQGNVDSSYKFITDLFSTVIQKLKNAGALVGIQCMDKCDWAIPIKAGVDLISYDAYNNPNNLTIIPDILIDFIRRGGIINWGIVPVVSDNVVKELSLDYLQKRLESTFEGVIISGVPAELLHKSAMVSVNGNMNQLSAFFAERAIMLASQLSSKLGVLV